MTSRRDRVVRISLKGLFPTARFYGADDIWVQACTADARRCQSGQLFVAVDDGRQDGHDLTAEAVARGAHGVMAERLLPEAVPQCVVEDSRAAFARLCEALAGYPSDRMTMVGVGGSHGKTTVQWLLASILEADRQSVGVWGSLGRLDGAQTSQVPVDVATPESLARWLKACQAQQARHCIVETSSRGLAARTFDALRWDVAVVTNCGRDHLRHHGTWENYRTAKSRIFQQVKEHGTVVMSADDPGCRAWSRELDLPVLTFGLQDHANVTGQLLESYAGEQSMLLHLGDESAAVQTKMFGEHHVQNCLAAAAAALVLGIDTSTIVRGLESLDSIPGKLERVSSVTRTAVYLDEARTPQSLALVLSALRRVTSGRLFVVSGGGYLSSPERARLGRIAERFADVAVLSSHRLQRRAPLRVIHDMLDGFAKPGRAQVLPDRAKAICWALSEAGPDDAVLLVGPQRARAMTARRRHFRDIDVVLAWQEAFDSASGPTWAAA